MLPRGEAFGTPDQVAAATRVTLRAFIAYGMRGRVCREIGQGSSRDTASRTRAPERGQLLQNRKLERTLLGSRRVTD